MIRLLHSIILVAFHLCVIGQGLFPFPDSAATWVTSYSIMTTPPPFPTFTLQSTLNVSVNGADTLIAGDQYTKMREWSTGYYGAVRDVVGQVFFVPKDSVQEYLVYDFTAIAGDTLKDVLIGFPQLFLTDVVVNSVYPDPSFGGRLVVDLQYGKRWIEGVGNEQGLFTEPWPNVSSYWLQLECMSHLDTIRMQSSGFYETVGTCTPLHVGMQEDAQDRVSVYPNPVVDQLFIEGSNVSQVVIWDMQGSLVKYASLTDGVIDVSDLASGLYQLVFTEEDNVQLIAIQVLR